MTIGPILYIKYDSQRKMKCAIIIKINSNKLHFLNPSVFFLSGALQVTNKLK